MKTRSLSIVILSIALFLNACSTSNIATPAEQTPKPSPVVPAITSTAAPEINVPSGWETHQDSQLHFSLSHPSEAEGAYNGEYSWLLNTQPANTDEAMHNFVYVSVIPKDFQGVDGEIYNYNTAATKILLSIPVGESKSVHANLNEGFTYTRLPDTTINGQTAMAFENTQPWEFPAGTKEIRYYLQLEDFTILFGAYVDTSGSDQPGNLTEDLFNQIVATFQVLP